MPNSWMESGDSTYRKPSTKPSKYICQVQMRIDAGKLTIADDRKTGRKALRACVRTTEEAVFPGQLDRLDESLDLSIRYRDSRIAQKGGERIPLTKKIRHSPIEIGALNNLGRPLGDAFEHALERVPKCVGRVPKYAGIRSRAGVVPGRYKV